MPTSDSHDERRTTAWIGQGVTIRGTINSAQDLRIDGTIDGSIEVGSHTLSIGAGASVTANLKAKSVVISGTVHGNVTATDQIQLEAAASVEGDLTTPRLIMADGAHVQGKIAAGTPRT